MSITVSLKNYFGEVVEISALSKKEMVSKIQDFGSSEVYSVVSELVGCTSSDYQIYMDLEEGNLHSCLMSQGDTDILKSYLELDKGSVYGLLDPIYNSYDEYLQQNGIYNRETDQVNEYHDLYVTFDEFLEDYIGNDDSFLDMLKENAYTELGRVYVNIIE